MAFGKGQMSDENAQRRYASAPHASFGALRRHQ